MIVSEEFVHRRGLEGQAVEIVAQTMATDMPSTFEEHSSMKIVGYDMTKKAATECFRKAGMFFLSGFSMGKHLDLWEIVKI